jgi:hypothetical protein
VVAEDDRAGFVFADTLVAFFLGFTLSSSFSVEWHKVTGCPVPDPWVVWSSKL